MLGMISSYCKWVSLCTTNMGVIPQAEYIRTKVRELGRLLLSLRKKSSIFCFEDALKPNNFYKVVDAVKAVAGYDEGTHSYKTPSLALKLGHSLNKITDIVVCRAIAAENDDMVKSAERFKRLCSTEWSGLVSHAALNTFTTEKLPLQTIVKKKLFIDGNVLGGLEQNDVPFSFWELHFAVDGLHIEVLLRMVHSSPHCIPGWVALAGEGLGIDAPVAEEKEKAHLAVQGLHHSLSLRLCD